MMRRTFLGKQIEGVSGGRRPREKKKKKKKEKKKEKNIPAITHMLTTNEPRRSIRRHCRRFLKNGLYSEI